MLTLNNISVFFDTTQVLNNISCSINQGDFIVILGPNGAGKSTLFNILSGHIKPNTGTILWNNADITNADEINRSLAIGRLFQNPNLNIAPTMTVKQNLAMALYKGKTTQPANGFAPLSQQIIDTLSTTFNIDLTPLLEKPMKSLSGGQRQLIAFMMATIVPPQLLLLDEPTAALDPEAATLLLTNVNQYVKHNKTTTLLITHDQNLAHVMGNKVWVLDKGTIKKTFDKKDAGMSRSEMTIGSIQYDKLKA